MTATRTYYSHLEFNVEAESEDKAYNKAKEMIDNYEVEFKDMQCLDVPDHIEVWETNN